MNIFIKEYISEDVRIANNLIFFFFWTITNSSEKAMAIASTLAWKIPWTEEPGRLQSVGSLSRTTEQLHFHFSLWCFGEGNGNPLQCSCLENPRDGGAWWAAVHGVAQGRTRLKWLSSSSSSNVTNSYIWNQRIIAYSLMTLGV